MATLAQASFEGGANGDPLGGEPGFTMVGSGTYDSTVANTGVLSGLFGRDGWGYLRHSLAVNFTPWRCRMYVRRGPQAQTTHPFLIEYRATDNTYVGDFQLRNESGGQYRLRWGYNSHINQASTAAPIEQWQRIDVLYRGPNESVGVQALLFDPADDSTVQETLEIPSFGDALGSVRVGIVTNADMDYWLDDILLTDTLSDPGPAGGAPPQPPQVGQGLVVGTQQAVGLNVGDTPAVRAYRGSTLIFGSAP